MTRPSVRVRLTVPSLVLHPDRPHVIAIGCGGDDTDELRDQLRVAEWETGHRLARRR
jgi:hypothetical protein